jgi:DNA-binding transcriptional LysR family regulator
MGISQSALSQTIRQLEARLGVRLLTRTTSNVAPTEAGERLLRVIGPRNQIEQELDAVRNSDKSQREGCGSPPRSLQSTPYLSPNSGQ